jgi:cobalt-zinc-cadmium efflux system outer membrane protein
VAKRLIVFAAGIALAICAPASAAAEDVAPPGCSSVSRENVARCALSASPAVRVEREAVAAASGRRTAAAPWFPSNPVLSFSAAHRAGPEGRVTVVNYYATLSQEVELAGQRAARRRAADAEVTAHAQDVIAVSRRTAAAAYAAYFDVLAAREALDVAQRLETTARQVARVTAGRAEAGVASKLDAEVTEAASLRVVQSRIGAERELSSASSRLAVLLGRDAKPDVVSVSGVLEPLVGSDALAASASSRLVRERPELRALASEQRAFEARADAFRRARVPAVTLQVYAQNDGFNERVLGAGLALPIPLPQPVGRFYDGEIAEAEALARQTRAESDAVSRELSTDFASALVAYQTRRAEAELYTEARVTRAEQLMTQIGVEIEGGRLPVRDAIVAQQQLIDVLRGHVETRRALCLASVDLALAAGVALESESR